MLLLLCAVVAVAAPSIDLASAEDVTEIFRDYATERSNVIN